MKQKGLIPQNVPRLVVASIPSSGYFYEIPWDSKQPGDILVNSNMSHVALYEGNNQIIHASNSAPYPKGGVKESSLYFTGKAYRIKGYGVQ
jgi:cell wall-associated NlpC family hydrolase